MRARHFITIILLLSASCFCAPEKAFAAATNPETGAPIVLLTPSSQGFYGSFLKNLTERTDASEYRFDIIPLNQFTHLPKDATAVITLGSQALIAAAEKSAAAESSVPILAALVTSNEYHRLRLPVTTERAPVIALFHDAPLTRQLLLIDSIFPPSHRIGLIARDTESTQIQQAQVFAESSDRVLNINQSRDTDSFYQVLAATIKANDVLLAINEPLFYNASTIRSVLLTSYRSDKVVVGYSANLVRAGGLASTFSTVPMLSDQVKELLDELDPSTTIIDRQLYATRFDVALNSDVARSLNITLPPRQTIIDDIIRAEREAGLR